MAPTDAADGRDAVADAAADRDGAEAVHADGSRDADADDLTRPPFRGCVFCYAAELAVYAARSARR